MGTQQLDTIRINRAHTFSKNERFPYLKTSVAILDNALITAADMARPIQYLQTDQSPLRPPRPTGNFLSQSKRTRPELLRSTPGPGKYLAVRWVRSTFLDWHERNPQGTGPAGRHLGPFRCRP